jgi:hypothetical protein
VHFHDTCIYVYIIQHFSAFLFTIRNVVYDLSVCVSLRHYICASSSTLIVLEVWRIVSVKLNLYHVRSYTLCIILCLENAHTHSGSYFYWTVQWSALPVSPHKFITALQRSRQPGWVLCKAQKHSSEILLNIRKYKHRYTAVYQLPYLTAIDKCWVYRRICKTASCKIFKHGINANIVSHKSYTTVWILWLYMLQAGSSRVRFPMRSLDSSIDLNLPAALWPWGRLGL